MSEPAWVALGAAQVDYEGPWAAGTAYAPGDVVTYAGVTYLAVNPSTGQTPPSAFGTNIPVVTALPGGPVDGQEVILVDSLTLPTYQWRMRYMASITDANKWVYVGGAPLSTSIVTDLSTGSTTYVDISGAPSLSVPRAGIYQVAWHTLAVDFLVANKHLFCSLYYNGAVDTNYEGYAKPDAALEYSDISRRRRITVTAAGIVKLQYKVEQSGQGGHFMFNELDLVPARLA